MSGMCEGNRGALVIWHDMPVDMEERADMLAWYDHEHHPERVAIRGFLGVCRYHAVAAPRELFIRYRTLDAAVLSSPSYRARVDDPTAWSRRCQPRIRNNSRTVCAVLARSGMGEGGFVATVAFAADGWDEALAARGWRSLTELAKRHPAVVSVEMLAADRSVSGLPSTEKDLRGAADEHVGGLFILHASDLDALRQALAQWRDDWAVSASAAPAATGLFALAFRLDRNAAG